MVITSYTELTDIKRIVINLKEIDDICTGIDTEVKKVFTDLKSDGYELYSSIPMLDNNCHEYIFKKTVIKLKDDTRSE